MNNLKDNLYSYYGNIYVYKENNKFFIHVPNGINGKEDDAEISEAFYNSFILEFKNEEDE